MYVFFVLQIGTASTGPIAPAISQEKNLATDSTTLYRNSTALLL